MWQGFTRIAKMSLVVNILTGLNKTPIFIAVLAKIRLSLLSREKNNQPAFLYNIYFKIYYTIIIQATPVPK
jgi:hypothetical protein